MIYRRRTYRINPEGAERFTRFFYPVFAAQSIKTRSLFGGRWINESRTEITAIREYESMDHYRHVQQKIINDPLLRLAQEKVGEMKPFILDVKEDFLHDTLDEKWWETKE